MMRDALISFPMFGDNFVLNPPSYILIGNFPIYLYGIVIALGFLLAFLYVFHYGQQIGLSADDIYDLVLFAVPSAIVGARLYYVIFNFSLYADNLLSIFDTRSGGLAIYGGVIGAVIALYLRCRHRKISFFSTLDAASFGLLIGQLIGRWGNFFNREAFGYQTDIFCRMGLTLPGQTTLYVHPTFLYESLWNLVGFLILHSLRKKSRKYEGQFFLFYIIWYGLGRAMIEGLRTDSLWLIPDVIRVSQLLALVSMLAALIISILNFRRLKAGRPLVLGHAIDAHDTIEKEADPAAAEGGEQASASPKKRIRNKSNK